MNIYSFGNCVSCCTPEINSATSNISGSDNILTVNFTPCTPANTFHLWYRPQGSSISYRDGGTSLTSPFVVTDSLDAEGTQYEGYIQSECGGILGEHVIFATSATTNAIYFRFFAPLNGQTYFDNFTDACNALTNFGCGTATVYVKHILIVAWAGFEAATTAVTCYDDSNATVLFHDTAIPANSTKYRIISDGTSCFVVIYQTDVSNLVSIQKENC